MYYLYNGVRLPALPEWDIETCPYAFITKQVIGGTVRYALTASSAPYVKYTYGGGPAFCPLPVSEYPYYDWIMSSMNNADIGWSALSGSYIKNTGVDMWGGHELIWSNYDFMDYDNDKLYLAKSDPIPVLNPTAILMGYSMGAKL